MKKHSFTSEHRKFIIEHVAGRKVKELMALFNAHFGLSLGLNQIRAFVNNNKLQSGVDSKFKKGCSSYNKGKKGVNGYSATTFKVGNKPHNYKPVGSERINTYGYADIKVADPGKWKAKHVLLWEKENGPLPKSHVVIFGDGDRTNFDLDNLLLVSRKQLVVMNKNKLISGDVESTKTGIIVADLYSKMSELKKGASTCH